MRARRREEFDACPHESSGMVTLLALIVAAMPSFPVAGFEDDLCGWRTNDAGYTSRATPAPTLVSIATVPVSTGGRCLEVRFRAGEGWANAYMEAGDLGREWSRRRVDAISFRLRGDAQTARLQIGVQAWAGDFQRPAFFALPLPPASDAWQTVTVRFADLQRADPSRPLRLPELITLQFQATDSVPEATFQVDEIRALATGAGPASLWQNPLDAATAGLPAAKVLPRIGQWSFPARDPRALEQTRRLGIGFASTDDRPAVDQSNWVHGIVTNVSVGRPTAAEVLDGLGLSAEDLDQDAQGRRTGEGIESSVFHPAVVDRFIRHVERRVQARAGMPWVAAFTLSSPISKYGEVHYAASTAGQYAVHSRPARANYRRWLWRAYGADLARLSRAWGREVRSWDAIVPPAGPIPGPSGIDERTEWSDFMHWYSAWLDEVTWRSLVAARRHTDKPIGAMIGGPKIGLSQGIALGNVGPVMRMLGRLRPAFFNDTDAQTLFSTRYTRAAASQYGVALMVEHVGPPHLDPYHHVNKAMNALACGADHVHFAHFGELFDDAHWMARTWRGLLPHLAARHTGHVRSDAAIFHSFVTSWYRPERGNGDAVSVYDSTNTLWFAERGYPSWGRVLGSPDVVDDTMVEDGALRGRKLLVVPNTSVTLTTRRAARAIVAWVRAGGALVGFGEGCLSHVVEADRSVRRTGPMLGLIDAGALAAALRDGARPAVRQVGRGRVVLYPYSADPNRPGPGGVSGAHAAVPELRRLAAESGVRTWSATDAGTDVNVMYAGRDRASGRHLFVGDFVRLVKTGLPAPIYWRNRTVRITFDPSLRGEAELFGITDAFERSEGGEAQYDAESGALTVRFTLPASLTLVFGDGRNGLDVAKHPLLVWQGNDLVLRGGDGYGVAQVQAPIAVGADGSLAPADARVLYLVHGDLHRPRFGGGPAFRVTLDRPGAFVVRVNSVTPAGAVLTVEVNGREVVRRTLPDRDGQAHPLVGEYAEEVTIPLSPGEHTIRVDNRGGDWLSVDRYVFRGFR
ncbi:MAG TPA: alpha-amylase family protein [Chthonomonadales bacterium]|nr:alpha-amylase family protein [Chthonomonadales bacterium]